MIDTRILEKLSEIIDPCSSRLGRPLNIVDMGLVEDVRIEGATAYVDLVLTEPSCVFFFDFHQKIEDALLGWGGIETVKVALDDNQLWTPDRIAGRRPLPLRPK